MPFPVINFCRAVCKSPLLFKAIWGFLGGGALVCARDTAVSREKNARCCEVRVQRQQNTHVQQYCRTGLQLTNHWTALKNRIWTKCRKMPDNCLKIVQQRLERQILTLLSICLVVGHCFYPVTCPMHARCETS